MTLSGQVRPAAAAWCGKVTWSVHLAAKVSTDSTKIYRVVVAAKDAKDAEKPPQKTRAIKWDVKCQCVF